MEIYEEAFELDPKLKHFDIGFHGDQYLIDLAFGFMNKADAFIETGTNTGSTLVYVGRNFPSLPCYSCEPRKDAYEQAVRYSSELHNVNIRQIRSPEFLQALVDEKIIGEEDGCVFWLDAHGLGYQWPLQKEIGIITRSFKKFWIFIDDFKVPGHPQFGFDEYDGQICDFNYIRPHMYSGRDYTIYYPNYEIKTSSHHPLRGWILIMAGEAGAPVDCLATDCYTQVHVD